MDMIRKKLRGISVMVVLTIMIPCFFTFIFAGVTEENYKGEPAYGIDKSGQTIIVKNGLKRQKLDLEMFIPCVLMSVADIETEEEVLKALAVLIRTEIKYKIRDLRSVEADSLNMSYVTYQAMEEKWQENFGEYYNYLMKIVNHTAHQVVKYEGNLIMPYYHQMSAGYTREGAYNYLISAKSEGDLQNEKYITETFFSNEDFVSRAESLSKDMELSVNAPIVTLQILEKDSAGYVLSLQLDGVEVSGEAFAKAFNLKSTNFNVETFNNNIKITVKGDGHGYGVSISGAEVYAAAGWTYVQILTHYYPEDISLE